jgi:hypothetical protein
LEKRHHVFGRVDVEVDAERAVEARRLGPPMLARGLALRVVAGLITSGS